MEIFYTFFFFANKFQKVRFKTYWKKCVKNCIICKTYVSDAFIFSEYIRTQAIENIFNCLFFLLTWSKIKKIGIGCVVNILCKTSIHKG